MASYRFLVQQLCGSFEGCEFHHVPRAENDAADALSKMGSSIKSIRPSISLVHIKKPSIKPSPESESIFIPAELESPAAKATDRKKKLTIQEHSATPGAAKGTPGAAVVISGTDVFMQEAASSAPPKAPAVGPPALEPAVAAVLVVVAAPSWVQPFCDFLVDGTLPSDEVEARQVQR